MQKGSKVPYVGLVLGGLPFFLHVIPSKPSNNPVPCVGPQHPDKGTWGDKETSLKLLARKQKHNQNLSLCFLTAACGTEQFFLLLCDIPPNIFEG